MYPLSLAFFFLFPLLKPFIPFSLRTVIFWVDAFISLALVHPVDEFISFFNDLSQSLQASCIARLHDGALFSIIPHDTVLLLYINVVGIQLYQKFIT